MKKRILSIFTIIIVAVIIFILFPKTYVMSYDRIVCQSFEELYDNSDLIVKGNFTEYLETVYNMIDEGYKTYSFSVSEVIKGNDMSNILFAQRKEVSYSNTLKMTTVLDDDLFIEPNISSSIQYILFLDYDKENNWYVPATEPFIGVVDNDNIKLESHLFNNSISNKKYLSVIPIYINVKYELSKQIEDFSNTYTDW